MSNNKIIPLIIYPENNGYVNSITPTVSGTGEPNASISVVLNNANFSTQVDQLGSWSVAINNPLTDGQSYSLIVKQTDKENCVNDTMVSFNVNVNGLPQHTISSPLNNGHINNQKPTINGNGKPGAIIEMRLKSDIYITNVNAYGDWSIEINKPLSDGFVAASIIQKDMGNFSPALNLNFTISTQTPNAPEIVTPSDMSYIGTPTPTIVGQAKSNATLNVIVDDTPYTTKADECGKWNIEVSQQLCDDTHILSAKQQDLAGNISEEAISIFNIDTVAPPSPIIHTPENGQFIKISSPTIIGVGEAENIVEVKHNEKIYSTTVDSDGKWTLDITDKLPDGPHTFNIYQIDKAGNYSQSTILMVKINTIAPLAPSVIYPINEEYVNCTCFAIKGIGEPDAKVEITLAGVTYNTNVLANGSWSIHIDDRLFDGQAYSIIASQIDLSGNVSPSVRVKFRVDTNNPPAPTCLYPLPDSVINIETPIISGKSIANATVNAQINNLNYSSVANSNGDWSIQLNQRLLQGINQITLSQIDMGNTSKTSTISFTIDTTQPNAPSITTPTSNQIINQNNVIISGTGETGCTIDIKLDDKCYQTAVGHDGTWSISIDFVDIGIHTIIVCQVDAAKNYSPSNIINFNVDVPLGNYTPNNRPAFGTITYNPNDTNWTNITIATLTTDKPVRLNNTVGRVFTKTITENGLHTFNFQDLEGNSGFVDAGVTWIDNTAPALCIDYNGNYFSSDKTIKYDDTSSGIKSALLNGAPFESGRVVNCEGYYNVQVIDNAGNIATKCFVIDKSTPKIMGVENNSNYNGEVYITFNDDMSGIKYAILDNKPILSGTIVNEKGNHILKVSDFGDNVTELNFTIN
jgi:hypothetical protein